MDWRPWEVKQCSIADFVAAMSGWQKKFGESKEISEDEAAEIRRLAFDD